MIDELPEDTLTAAGGWCAPADQTYGLFADFTPDPNWQRPPIDWDDPENDIDWGWIARLVSGEARYGPYPREYTDFGNGLILPKIAMSRTGFDWRTGL
jgi:hypothetical protein